MTEGEEISRLIRLHGLFTHAHNVRELHAVTVQLAALGVRVVYGDVPEHPGRYERVIREDFEQR